MQGTRMLGRAQQTGILFFFFVLLRDLRGCNEAQHSRWTFYKVVKLAFGTLFSISPLRTYHPDSIKYYLPVSVKTRVLIK